MLKYPVSITTTSYMMVSKRVRWFLEDGAKGALLQHPETKLIIQAEPIFLIMEMENGRGKSQSFSSRVRSGVKKVVERCLIDRMRERTLLEKNIDGFQRTTVWSL